MGYTTWFDGYMIFDNPISNDLIEYINNFSNIRHMKRNVTDIKLNDRDWEKKCYNGELGEEGEYYIGDDGGIDDPTIVDYNHSPKSQPGLWCNWIIDNSVPGNPVLEWNEAEKFYYYCEWLQYLINNFFKPEGLHLSGEISFEGEESDDTGVIDIVVDEYGNDRVRVRYYKKVLEKEGIIF